MNPARWLAVWAGLTIVGLLLYAPALAGALFGDDLLYTLRNPWVRDPSLSHLAEILAPFGEPARYVTNYAPLHLLAHSVQMQLFGATPASAGWLPGYHATNVAVHAAGTVLLGRYFVQRGLTPALACAGAALFFVHPANVEAVAWVTQLKTTLSFALAMAALLAFERKPLASATLFAAAILTKATAAIALPIAAMSAALDWPKLAASERRDRVRALGLQGAVFLAYAAGQALAFQGANAAVAPIHDEWPWRLASMAMIAGTYLWMAATSLGLSTYHEPSAVESLSDGRLWFSLIAIAAIAWRSLHALRRRSPESLFWAFAIGSFVPVSQLLPFLYPVADRYLYFILPGLLGALLFALEPWVRPGDASTPAEWLRGPGRRIGAAALALVLVAFTARAVERSAVWGQPDRILQDAVENYPYGIIALGLEARSAALAGDPARAATLLRRSMERGFEGLEQLLIDPAYQQHRGHPALEPVLRDLAELWSERLGARRPDLSQLEWRQLARAQLVLDDPNAARESFRSAIRRGGPHDEAIRSELQALVRTMRGAR